MQDLKITLIQQPIISNNCAYNRANFEKLILNIPHQDLFILPEVFSTGFTMKAEQIAEPMNGPTMQWLTAVANQTNAAISGSVVITESGNYFNRLIFMQPDGQYYYYDKRHLFRMANEDKYYSNGNKRLILNYKGWRICPMVCYDLRFPVWSRNNNEFDLLFYVANWPASREQHWSTLLKARAIENLCYVAGVNRLGVDDNQTNYSGDSVIINAQGTSLLQCNNQPGCFSYNLNYDDLQKYRDYFPADKDADKFELLP